jgi:hypothetical protein
LVKSVAPPLKFTSTPACAKGEAQTISAAAHPVKVLQIRMILSSSPQRRNEARPQRSTPKNT